MKSKTLLKKVVLVPVFLGAVFSLGLVSNFVFKSKVETASASLATDSALFYEQGEDQIPLPVRLKIPKIKVNAIVEYVGLTPDGAMDSPKGPANVGWFNLGYRPGEIGSAVIDGHSGWKNNIPAVFDNLYKLKRGDKIFVEDEKGITTTFVVREIRKYNPKADASDVFGSSDNLAHLNLITCTGIWNKVWKSRSSRLVVFTDKVE